MLFSERFLKKLFSLAYAKSKIIQYASCIQFKQLGKTNPFSIRSLGLELENTAVVVD